MKSLGLLLSERQVVGNRLLKFIITSALVVTLGFIMAGCSSNSTPPSGEELSPRHLEINLLGDKKELLTDSQGVLKSMVELTSADGGISLFLDKMALFKL